MDRSVVLPDGTTADVERIKIGVGGDDVYLGDVGGTVKDGATNKNSAMWTEPRPDTFEASPTVTLTVSATPTAYANGDNLGGLLTITNAAKAVGSGLRVDAVTMSDAAKQSLAVDLVFFKASIGTPTDHSAFHPSATDVVKHRGTISVGSSDWSNYTTNGVACKQTSLVIPSLTTTSLFVVLVARSTPTFTANDNLTLALALTRL